MDDSTSEAETVILPCDDIELCSVKAEGSNNSPVPYSSPSPPMPRLSPQTPPISKIQNKYETLNMKQCYVSLTDFNKNKKKKKSPKNKNKERYNWLL